MALEAVDPDSVIPVLQAELEEFLGRMGSDLMSRLNFLWRLFQQGSRRTETRIVEEDTKRSDTRCFHRDLDTGNGNVRYRIERRNIGWLTAPNIPDIVYHLTIGSHDAPCDLDINLHVKENGDTGELIAICGFTIIYPSLWPTPQNFTIRSTYTHGNTKQCEDAMPCFLETLDGRITALTEVLPELAERDFSNPPPQAS